MRFGRIPLDEAEGALLAHSVRLTKGTFKKGRRLSADDVVRLGEEGHEAVVAARLDPEDVGEDEAATLVAEAVAGSGTTASAAFTGRVNLFAAAPGVAVVDRERLDRINLIDEAVTVATLPPYAVVAEKQMVATIKIIPFAAPRAVLDRVLAVAREGGPIVRAAPFVPRRVALIQTRLPSVKDSVLDKTVGITRARIETVGGTLVAEERCDHEEATLAETIARIGPARADVLLIAGASAIVDRRDVLPAAIEAAGGDVVHFGMPVDPGNLILMGRLGQTDVVGLPGCARSPKLNGFDWVLERLAAGIPVDARDIMLMGAGGLLTEISTRPLPRAQATRKDRNGEEASEDGPPRAPRIAALVLAAGRSSRMGAANKLLEPVQGRPMLLRVLDAVERSKARPIVVVTGHEAERVSALLGGRNLTVAHNPAYADGLAGSLRTGLRALPDSIDGVVVCLADMPRIEARHIERLIAAFNPVEGRAVCVPTHAGRRGNPVLWASRFLEEMQALQGDSGAKRLIDEHEDLVAEVAMDDDGVLVDVDTPPELAAANS